MPRLYGLPKIHKPGNKYRPVVSNINAPSYKLSKWLVEWFNNMKSFDNFSVKNSIELTSKLNGIILNDDQSLVSFDIESYFPSIPIPKALKALEAWLDKQNIHHFERQALMELTKVCLDQTYFAFRDKFYHQTEGTAMGNPLSPFICCIYINSLEDEFSNQHLFPKTWHRYVDDILAIVETSKIDDTLQFLNSMCPNIRFTVEIENNHRLPFLDLLILRMPNGKIAFDIYRKETATQRYITNDSNHHQMHKRSAFNSMIFRMCKVPLSDKNYEKELSFIYETAVINGYSKDMIDSLVKKTKRRIHLHNITSLKPIVDKPKFSAINFHPLAHNAVKQCFDNNNVKLIPKSSQKISQLLNSTKDRRASNERSGIYKAVCDEPNCNAIYIGQTRRELKTRIKEHLNYIRNLEPYKSGIAHHAIEHRHNINENNFTLLKSEQFLNRLNILESLYIYINKEHSVNRDGGPFVSDLFTLLD